MQKKPRIKLSVSLPTPMVAWLREEAEKDLDDLSGIIRKHLLASMRAEEEKKAESKKKKHSSTVRVGAHAADNGEITCSENQKQVMNS